MIRYELKLLGDTEYTHSSENELENYILPIEANWGYLPAGWYPQSQIDKVKSDLDARGKSAFYPIILEEDTPELGYLVIGYEDLGLDENNNQIWGDPIYGDVMQYGETVYRVDANYEITETNIDTAIAKANVKKIIGAAMNFGQSLILDFATENVILGITQDGMTGTVLTNMAGVTNALNTGSLYEAMAQISAVPNEAKDVKYITNARLLEYLNKIEAYLGLEISEAI